MKTFLLEVGKLIVWIAALAMAASCFACLGIYAASGEYVTAGLFGLIGAVLVIIMVVILEEWS